MDNGAVLSFNKLVLRKLKGLLKLQHILLIAGLPRYSFLDANWEEKNTSLLHIAAVNSIGNPGEFTFEV